MEIIKTPKVENVQMLNKYNNKLSSIGTLYLTATHLIFVDPDCRKETWILHNHIANVDKQPLTTTGSPLLIRCKTFQSVTFVIPKERDCYDIFLTLSQLSKPVNINDLYCFHYTSSTEDIPKSAGWNFFDLQSEYQRMRVPNDAWSATDLNKNFELCDTYPRYLWVPSSATPEMLTGSSNFRSKGRLPVLSYLHKNKAVICRCSQPLSGFSGRCPKDESMLNSILRTNPNASYMYVVDTRPKINAMANRATGKGYENEMFYENIKFHFLGIENIHVMRSSLSKLIETCELKSPTMSNFLRGLESSGWLKHIQSILETSLFIAQAVESGVSVVVHCSDGWDRTAQVCSIASLLLDPYYRTINGYQALIEKDWLAFGHKFSDRFGHLNGDSKEISPILTQFIDATWQIWSAFPRCFQFNEKFLLTIHDHATSCQFGTFVGNCEKERIDLRLSEKTFSLWGYMANHVSEYLNPLFHPEENCEFLILNTASQNIRFWRDMYCRFESGVHPREPLNDILLATMDHSTSMREHIKHLQQRIAQLRKLTGNTENIDSDLDLNKNSAGEKNEDLENDLKNSLKVSETVKKVSVKPEIENCDLPINQKSDGIRLTDEMLKNEIESVALDWKTLRNIVECKCTTPFDYSTRKNHCWKCGDVFCTRCIDKMAPLPGLSLKRPVPVCRQCYAAVKGYGSLDSP
ncbi:hypothetical protein RUM44_007777 [Polyplax serrata]|uniref:phosphatidylinositol-3,5-bisphosphate 3-phosphatase n=1 Tax=Polyplax serrata TaxID=468196 RepID=A0ABR1BAI4_POLSC